LDGLCLPFKAFDTRMSYLPITSLCTNQFRTCKRK
jgi:hypothetical protein